MARWTRTGTSAERCSGKSRMIRAPAFGRGIPKRS